MMVIIILLHPLNNIAVVTATNNINNELGRSLMDKTFPYNDQFMCLPEVHDQEALSALTPNSAAGGAAGTFAWLRGKFTFLNPKPDSGSEKFAAV